MARHHRNLDDWEAEHGRVVRSVPLTHNAPVAKVALLRAEAASPAAETCLCSCSPSSGSTPSVRGTISALVAARL
jgi:hypothetical protein